MKKRFKLVKKAITYTLVLSTLATFNGCVKEVDCNIKGKHVHLYINEDSTLSRYVESEKEYMGDLFRTESYLPMTNELDIVVDNKLYMIEDNIKYLTSQINGHQPKRESYSYEYVYGSYYGYGYSLNPANGKFEYRYGLQTGWHNGYGWQDIDLNEYTDDKVRDITYKFKFYKINEDGSITSKFFNSLEELSVEYKYFKTSDLVQENISDSYYLGQQK